MASTIASSAMPPLPCAVDAELGSAAIGGAALPKSMVESHGRLGHTPGMSRIPDFTKVELGRAEALAAAHSGDDWLTPEGVVVKRVYAAADTAGLDFLDGYPGVAPYLRGPYPTM